MFLTLRLMGPLRLLAADGRELTPRSHKARGALAILGTAPQMRTPRSRVQDLLWSASPPQQGAASLRQTVHDLRQAMDADADALLTGPGWIGLDPARLRVDLRPIFGADGRQAEFAADLDIADPEFEDWLRDTRLALEDSAPAAPAEPEPWVLLLTPPEGADPAAVFGTSLVLQDAAAQAAALVPARLVPAAAVGSGGVGPQRGLAVGGICAPAGPGIVLLAVLRDAGTGAQLWTQRFNLPHGAASTAAGHAVTAIALAILRVAEQSAAQALFPLADVFSLSRDRLLGADARLARSETLAESPLGLSMRAWLRYTLIVERHARDPAACLEEAEGFVRRAHLTAPDDPTVLAVAAMLRSWRQDVAGALDLARLACRMAPDNDLARHVLSQALTDAGQHREALAMALRAGTGPLGVVAQASFLLRRTVAQIRVGRLTEAEGLAAAALAHAPDNRPSLRFLAALRHARGDEAGTAEALARLRAAEPDFSLRLMAAPEYPVSTLRQAGLLGVTRSGL